jgi:hypothetical protein
VSPSTGKAGDTISVGGTNFVDGATTVRVGGLLVASFVANGGNTILFTVPSGLAHVTAYSIAITTPSGTVTSGSVFTNFNAPTVTSSSPSSGRAGAILTLGGTNFIVGGTTVYVGGLLAGNVNESSTTALTCTVPSGLTQGSVYNIVATTYGGSGTRASAFTADNAPSISGISPTSGVVGTSITISGFNFATATTATIGGVNLNVTQLSDTRIVATIPTLSAGPRSVVITTPSGSANSSFTVNVPAPTISSVTTSRGANGALTGSTITISGANFTNAGFTIGGVAPTSASVTASSISFTCPNLSTDGTKAIVVTVDYGGTASSSVQFWAARTASLVVSTSTSGTYTPPQWANFMDVVVRGGGGGGGNSTIFAWGGGGQCGAAQSGTIDLVSTGFAARTYTVGAGGLHSIASGVGGTTTFAGLSGAGGASGCANCNGPAGTAGTAVTLGLCTSPAPTGGSFGSSAQAGVNPGSGGGGGNSGGGPFSGIVGRPGAVIIAIRQ